MPHDTPLITTIVAALVLAFIFGAIANRLKMPPIVGYLIAGVCVGPHSPGFVADQTLAPQLAEIGVILLMFGVGLNFSLKDLLSVKAVAIPGALIRMAFATAMGLGLGTLLGWPMLGGLVFGLALAVSSTVVTLKVLQDRHLIDSDRGRMAMGWLVVEDLAMVLALVLIPAFAGASAIEGAAGAAPGVAPDAFVTLTEQLLHTHLNLYEVLGLTLVKLLAFVGFMVVVGRRIIPFLLHATAHTGSRELFRLAVLAIALGVAAGSAYLFGVSLALGAFFAGMILSESELSQRAAQETLPLRDAFGVLFFVSVGMLFDPSIVVREPLAVVATLVIILFGKSIVGFLLMVLFRRPVAAALTVSASLAQIGEFSFILAALGVSLGLMPEEGRGLVLAGAIISIVLNPAAFWLSERLRPRLEPHAPARVEPELGPVVPDSADQVVPPHVTPPGEVLEEVAQPTSLSNHLILIGYGRVGSVVAGELLQEGAPFVLVEDAEGRVLAARAAGIEVIVGNAATREALRLANVMGARCIVIAIPNAFEAGQATEQCRKLNAAVKIIARAHSDEEVEYLDRLGADHVIMGEREIGLGMIDWLNGEDRNASRREGTAGPKLTGGENLLRQARQAQPPASPDVAQSLALAGEILPMPAPSLREEPPMLAETPIAEIPAGVTPAGAFMADVPDADEPQRLAAPPSPAVLMPPAEPPASPPETIVLPPPAEPAPDAAAEPAAAAGGETAREAAAEPVPWFYAPAPAAEADGTAAAPAWPAAEAMPLADAEPAPDLQRPAAAAPVAAAEPLPVAEAPAPAAELPTEQAPWSPAPVTQTTPEPERETASAAAATPAPAPIETIAVAVVEPAFGQGSSGFRVVPASDIHILPPEPPPGAAPAPAPEQPAGPAFRSEFWEEEEARPQGGGDGPELVADGPIPSRLRNVQEPEPVRPPIDDASWLAALERDLFGDAGVSGPGPGPAEEPRPTPQPIETPQPVEEPAPPAQPIETPHPAEEPVPSPQPIETPNPTEIPGTAPQPAPTPSMPPTRAEEDRADADLEADH